MMDLAGILRHIRRRWRTLAGIEAAARALIAVAMVAAVTAIVERALHPSDEALLAIVSAGMVLATGLAAAFVWPLVRRPADRQIARLIEERYPELEDTVVTAVEIEAVASRTGFAPLVLRSAAARLRALDLADVVDRRRARVARWRLGAATFALALAGVFAAPSFERTAQAAYLRLFPASVTVTVSPGDARVPEGRPMTISATLTGRRGTLTRIVPSVTINAEGRPRTMAMSAAGGGYQLRLGPIERSFTYNVTAGPARSRTYAVTTLYPPRVQRIELHYDFPSFTGLKPREERDGGDVYGPAGTRVRLVVHTDKPVAAGRLAFSEGKRPLPLARVDERTLESTMTVDEEAAYRVALADPDGLTSEGVEYFIRVMDDRPPDVHILRPSGDEQITPLQEVPIEARADDDYGIASFDMVYSVGGGQEQIVPFTTLGGTPIARLGSRMLAAEDLRVKPGDVIAYYARASDVARGKRSTMSRSEIFFLEVKPFNEEYTMAQSQAMAAATGTQLEGLIASQKEIISATWNLERRAGAGRSAVDVKNVADAQAELKSRAEEAAGAQRQRRRIGQEAPQRRAAQPQDPVSAGDPVRDAVDAMTRAVQQLQTLKTAEAIPHEMAALNALLQAEAEIRRRQLTQQQSNGGSYGGGRQGQDLSSLFDRELKRQQKTNYENKAQIESTPETTKSRSALDRIRDLAKRQEELTRRQRDLANGGLSADETKRQLEKLTREQEDLRRQLEEASKQMSAPDAQGLSRRNPDGARTGAVGDALERMREAASQLQNANAAGAASKADEAARQLRKAESQMQGASPDAQRRALGDMQLEAQQVADAQRRVANEAARLDREGGGAADARRRLANEKEQLADRIDALQQAGDRQAAAAGRDAARALREQQLGDRMRAGAKALRDQQSGKVAPREQQLADALDRLSRTLNAADAGGAKGDSQKLADQLDQVREARDRLARLEKQIKDARDQAEAGRGSQPGRAGQSGPEGQRGQRGARGDGQGGGDIARLQDEYNKELQRTRELMDRLRLDTPESGGRMTSPEQHEWSGSAPGTEAFKQDYAAWQSLSSDVAKVLERYEASVAGRLANALVKDRLRAGGSERVPDAYQKRVSRYFESLAKKRSS
jgi:hypothetical protein